MGCIEVFVAKKRGYFEKEAWVNLLWPIGIAIIAVLVGLIIPILAKFKQ
jgi:hypothetical protein